MEALIAREVALGGATGGAKKVAKAAAASGKKKRAPASSSSEPKQKVARGSASAETPVFNADWNEDEDEDEDEELEDNGYAVPDALADPPTAADAEKLVGRRVYIDGMRSRDAMAGELIGWRKNKSAWEVELDRGDERIFVASRNLRWLDQPPPPRKKPLKKKKAAAPAADGAGSGDAPTDAKKKSKKKKERT